jgi:NAD(P)-dependent dehydrogenase (short-subunit alcohol dehydrogenase family)
MARTILITGGASGLGRAMAEGLLADGHRVAIGDLNPQSIEETLAANSKAGERLAAFEVDLAAPGACERLVTEVEARFGPVEVIVNNAGLGSAAVNAGGPARRFWEAPPEVYDRIFAVNATAPFRLASILAPGMIGRGWGRIVNVTTGLQAMLQVCFYGGSKAVTEAHTACMALQLEGSGVTANVITPGGHTYTGMTRNSGIPQDQMYKAAIMAGPMRWLASDASNGISARRFVGRLWDDSLPPDAAAKIAGFPVAWTGFGATQTSSLHERP